MTEEHLFNVKKLKNILFNFLYYGLNILFPIITYPYIARVLGVDNVGLGNMALSLATYFTTVASLGIPIYGIREVAKCNKDKEKLSYLVSELLIINALGVIVSSIILFTLIFHIQDFRQNFIVYSLAGINLVLSFFQIDWLFQGIEKFKILMYRNFIVKLFSVILVFFLIKSPDDVNEYVLISVISLGLANLINIYEAKKIVIIKFQKLNLLSHVRSIIFFGMTRIVSSIYTILDTVILGILTSSYYVGLYTTALKLIRVVITIISSITLVFFSDTTRESLCENKDKLNERLTELFIFMFIICIPIYIFIAYFAELIILVFAGVDYIDASTTLKILSFLILISLLTNFIGMQVLYARNLEKYVLHSLIIGAFLCIITNLTLTPYYKHNGAAISVVFAEFGILIYQIYVVYNKNIKIFVNLTKKIKIAVFGIINYCFLLMLFDQYLDAVNNTFRLLILLIFSIIIYPIILYFLKEPIFLRLIRVFNK